MGDSNGQLGGPRRPGRAGGADVPWAVSLAQLLERVPSAAVLLGPRADLGSSGVDPLLEEGPPLQPHVPLAVDYETHNREPGGVFVLHDLAEEMAHPDLPARTALAGDGVSTVSARDLVFARCP